jgi:hypothetical protein
MLIFGQPIELGSVNLSTPLLFLLLSRERNISRRVEIRCATSKGGDLVTLTIATLATLAVTTNRIEPAMAQYRP